MRSKRKSFAEIMDVYAFKSSLMTSIRVTAYSAPCISIQTCSGQFKDYIAIPKANGYQSLHTTLFGMHGTD